jgi:hypothetical protein
MVHVAEAPSMVNPESDFGNKILRNCLSQMNDGGSLGLISPAAGLHPLTTFQEKHMALRSFRDFGLVCTGARRIVAALVVTLVSAVGVRADTILTNYPQVNDGLNAGQLGTGRIKIYRFNMPAGSGYSLTSVDVRMAPSAATDTADVSIWSDLSDGLGRQLVSLTGPPFTGTASQTYTATPVTSMVLQPGTSYWLVIASPFGIILPGSNPAPGLPFTGIATYDLTRFGMAGVSGTFAASTNRSTVAIFGDAVSPAVIGACCFVDGSCQFIDLATCSTGSGWFRGEGVTCDAAACPQITSCCDNVSGVCTLAAQGISYCASTATIGSGPTCSPSPCPVGACCSPDGATCTSIPKADCFASGGVPRGEGVACASILCGAGFVEVETNENKADADTNGNITFTAPGDYIRGNSTGSAAPDYFHLKLPAATLGIYRNRLTIETLGAVGHTGTIRGLDQTATAAGVWTALGTVGTPVAGSDATIQTSATSTTPARFNEWYGFGKQEELYYRVTGAAATTGDYLARWTRDAVTPVDIGNFLSGNITITNVDPAGPSTNTDLWIYDSGFNAIDGYGNDGASINGGHTVNTSIRSWLTRSYTAGTYYLALANTNVANNKGSPCDDNSRTGALMDFANVVVNNSTTTNVNIQFSVTDGSGTTPFSVTRTGSFDVLWYSFTVIGGGTCCASDGSCTFVAQANCIAPAIWTTGGSCTPNVCPLPPAGVCCRGTTCSTSVTQANCTAAAPIGALFVTSSSLCNSGGSTITPCCYADFNKNGTLQVQDIFDFLNSWFAGSLYAKMGGDGDSGTLAVQDIFDFLNAWFAGGC